MRSNLRGFSRVSVMGVVQQPFAVLLDVKGRLPLTLERQHPNPTMITILLALSLFVYLLSLLPRRRLTNDECGAACAIAATDNDEDIVLSMVEEKGEGDEAAEVVDLPRLGSPNYWRFSAKVAHVVKSKMGLPKATEANRMVALELVSKELLARHVRKCDVYKFQPLAVDLVFMPTKYDVTAARCRDSRQYRERLREMNPVRTWGDWLRSRIPFADGPWTLDGPGLSYSRG